jgi:hypothetical protein
MSIPGRRFHIRPVKGKTSNMKTKLFPIALTLLALFCAVCPITAQTVVWERKALGQQFAYPCGGTYNWPNNNAWSQDQLIAATSPCVGTYEAEPSNWNTPSYPNGASVDVILGNAGGAPTSLDRAAPITLHSLTILNVGGLTAEFGSRLTASVFDFQGDGSLVPAGGGGPNPTFNLTAGGTLKKSGGTGAYVIDPAIFLQVLGGGTIACEAGTLQLPSTATTYAGGVNFNAAAGAVIDLAPAEGGVVISGMFAGSNVGGTVRLKQGYLSTLAATDGATFNFAGDTFQWQGGAIESSAAHPFVNAGMMNITGTPFLHGQGFTNQGTLAQSGAGVLNLPFGRVLTNAASGIFDIRNDSGLMGAGGGGPNPLFNNFGTVRKSAGSGSSVIDRSIAFYNIQGTVRVDSGTLVFANGMTTRGGTGDGGTFVVESGATLRLTDGTNEADYHGTYTGSGGGTVLMNGGYLVPDTFNTGVTLNLPGAMFQWTGGVIGGYQSAVPVTNAGNITLAGTAEKATFGNFINNGTVTHTDTGRLTVSYPNSGGAFSNDASGIYDLQSDAGLYNGTFNNSGVFKKSGGTGTSIVELPFNNAGTVEALSGTLQFSNFTQASGATLMNGGNLGFVNEGVFNGGTLSGNGTITGSVKNNGATISPGFSPGTIAITGNYNQGANGILNLEIGGYTAGTEHDQLAISGSAALSGTLNLTLINGFRPKVNDVFQVLTFTGFTGGFSTINFSGFTASVTYSASGITFKVLTVPGIPLNIATRLKVNPDPNQLIGGLIITGSEPKKVIIRAIGPSLSSFFSGVLADPKLELFQGSTLLASNDNWKENGNQSAVEATGVPPSNELESAIVRTLAPGAYTAIVRGNGSGTGIGLVEVYDLDQNAKSKLGNIATRAFVDTNENVMIGGFIIGGGANAETKVVVRAIGPSLGAFGITGALEDPVLELKNSNGTTLLANDDWKESQEAAITQSGLAPTDPREAALVTTLPDGNYTAIVRGKNGGTGVAVVEVYNVD